MVRAMGHCGIKENNWHGLYGIGLVILKGMECGGNPVNIHHNCSMTQPSCLTSLSQIFDTK